MWGHGMDVPSVIIQWSRKTMSFETNHLLHLLIRLNFWRSASNFSNRKRTKILIGVLFLNGYHFMYEQNA